MNINHEDAAAIAQLRAVVPALDAGSRSFANSLIEAFEQYGSLTPGRRQWVPKIIARANAHAPTPVNVPASKIGALTAILELFNRARKHLKVPAVELGVPGFAGREIRVNVAGQQAKIPGSLTVLTAEKFDTGREFPERKWLGRILQDGTFQPAYALTDEPEYAAAVTARLKAFAADPSKVGAEDGILHGRCCFCRISLTDERSTAVGYGKKCATNWGLSWGARPAEFAGELL